MKLFKLPISVHAVFHLLNIYESRYCFSMCNSCSCQRDVHSKQAREMLVEYFCCPALAGCPEPLTSTTQPSTPSTHPQSDTCVFYPLLDRNSSSILVSHRNLLIHFLPLRWGHRGLLLLSLSAFILFPELLSETTSHPLPQEHLKTVDQSDYLLYNINN